MDYRKQIFKMLGIEPNEEFHLKRNGEFFVRLGAEKDEDRCLRFYVDKYLESYVVMNGWSEKGNHILSDILLGNVEIVKIPKPTKEEQIAIDYARLCGYKWLAKDKQGSVYAYFDKPNKKSTIWETTNRAMLVGVPISFLSWEDTEPYYIGGEEE